MLFFCLNRAVETQCDLRRIQYRCLDGWCHSAIIMIQKSLFGVVCLNEGVLSRTQWLKK